MRRFIEARPQAPPAAIGGRAVLGGQRDRDRRLDQRGAVRHHPGGAGATCRPSSAGADTGLGEATSWIGV